jgi:hypothetical protein
MSVSTAEARYETSTPDAVGYALQLRHHRNGSDLLGADVVGSIDFVGRVSGNWENVGQIESRWYSVNGGNQAMRFLTNGTLAMYIEDHGGDLVVTNDVYAAGFVGTTLYIDHVYEKTGGHKIVFEENIYLGNHNISSGNVNLNDDVATSFAPRNTHGMLCIHCQTSCSSAIIAYDVDGAVSIAITCQSGSMFEVTTGALAGTTGTDGKFTVSVHTDGKIYLENRTGGT